MADLDFDRAKSLLKSAEKLFKENDFAGCSGLAYQASITRNCARSDPAFSLVKNADFESTVIALTKSRGEDDYPDHEKRMKRAEELLKISSEAIKKLWLARNIDFYGNEKISKEKRALSKEEIENSLNEVRKIIEKTGRIIT